MPMSIGDIEDCLFYFGSVIKPFMVREWWCVIPDRPRMTHGLIDNPKSLSVTQGPLWFSGVYVNGLP